MKQAMENRFSRGLGLFTQVFVQFLISFWFRSFPIFGMNYDSIRSCNFKKVGKNEFLMIISINND